MRNTFLYLVVFFLVVSCGVILDPSKIQGEWNLVAVDFILYNSELDAYKTIHGRVSSLPNETNPAFGEFFGTNSSKYTLRFREGYFEVFDASSDTISIIDPKDTGWSVDSFTNTISISIKKADSPDNLWNSGLSFVNYWPLSTNNELELIILASDVKPDGKITVNLRVGTLSVYKMIGYFEKKTTS